MTRRTIADFWIAYRRIGPRLAQLQRDLRAAKTPAERAAAENLIELVIARWRMPAPRMPLRRKGIHHDHA
jgi:hypothetical protein